MIPSIISHAQDTIRHLFDFIIAQGNGDYLGEKVSQLEHSLQCAYLASESGEYGRDGEVILGALLHDVGRFIPAAKEMPKMIALDGTYVGRASHELLGERYLRQLGFSEKVCQLVGSHVMAKRYLTAVENGYYEGLSATSKRTLQYQGGVFNDEQVKEAQKDPLLAAKLAVRKWDDEAKVPGMIVPRLDSYQDVAVNSLIESRSQFILGSQIQHLLSHPMVIICLIHFEAALFESPEHIRRLPKMTSCIQKEGSISGEDPNKSHVRGSHLAGILDQLAKIGVRVSYLPTSNVGSGQEISHQPIINDTDNHYESEYMSLLDNIMHKMENDAADIVFVPRLDIQAKVGEHDYWEKLQSLESRIEILRSLGAATLIIGTGVESAVTDTSSILVLP